MPSVPYIIEETLFERDLGIIISSDLKWVHHIDKAFQDAQAITNKNTYFDADLVRLLYVSLSMQLQFGTRI